jgi:hypothetical protein
MASSFKTSQNDAVDEDFWSSGQKERVGSVLDLQLSRPSTSQEMGAESPRDSLDRGHGSNRQKLAAASRSPFPIRGRSNSQSSRTVRDLSNVSEQHDYILDLANPEREPLGYTEGRRQQKHLATFDCTLCPKRFTRAYKLRSHLRTHWNSLPRGPPPDEEAYSGQSSFDASSGGESQDEISDQELVAPLGQSLSILHSALRPTRSHPSTVTQSLAVLTPSPGTIKDNEISGLDVDQPDDHNSPLGSPQVVSGTTGMFQQHFVGLESLDLTPATTTMQSHDPIPLHMHRPPQSTSRYGPSIPQQASSQNFGHVGRSLATSGSLDSSSAAYPQEVGDKWLGMGGYRHRRSSSDHLSDISSPHNSPYLSTLNSFDHFSPMLNPSVDPTFSDGLGLGQLNLNNGNDAAQSFYGLGYSPHISPRLIPQQNGLPAFTADNNFGMVLEHSGQFMQPNDGPEILPVHGQDSSRFPSATPSQKSESKIRDLQVAPIVVPQARDDASPRRFSDVEHSRINGTADWPNSDFLLANPIWSHEARSVDLNDPLAARTDMAASTAQTAPEDANTSNTESGLSDYHHRPPSQSSCEKDLAASDLDEHELAESTTGPPLVHTAASSFGEARSELERLRLGIDTLENSSESSSDISRGEPELLVDSQYSSQAESEADTSGSAHDNEEGSGTHHEDSGSSRVNMHDTSTSDSPTRGHGRKRQRLLHANDVGGYTDVCLGEKSTRPPCKRFVCCFQHGPGRKCPGTDETISEVLKKMSEHHDTHVCDRCWVLKVKDESSGFMVHPDDVLECSDHCLSPQCHRTTPTIGHRHRFDQGTCKTKTSRVRPGDSEAVYRFIFSLVHPTLESPLEVVTAEHFLHLGAVPRQGRRKATREELTAQADRLGRRLEDLERQHIEGTDQVNRLKQELSDAHSNAERDREKTASLEARLRRVVAILGDALRTGDFRDQQGHRSLLMRVGEDAPDALSLFSHPSPSPPESTNGQQPSFLPTREKTNATAECQLFQNAYPMIANSAALDKTPHTNSLEIRTSQVPTMGVNVGGQEEMEIDWLNFPDESGNTSNISAYLDGFSGE